MNEWQFKVVLEKFSFDLKVLQQDPTVACLAGACNSESREQEKRPGDEVVRLQAFLSPQRTNVTQWSN